MIIHNLRQNLKLEKENAMKHLSNSKSNFKEKKSPMKIEKGNTQKFNINPYGLNLSISKPILKSSYIYNITKNENIHIDENLKISKLNISHENKFK